MTSDVRERLFEFDDLDPFTVGALGEPGARVFFLQAREDGTTGHR